MSEAVEQADEADEARERGSPLAADLFGGQRIGRA
jgi:hypothetical protein